MEHCQALSNQLNQPLVNHLSFNRFHKLMHFYRVIQHFSSTQQSYYSKREPIFDPYFLKIKHACCLLYHNLFYLDQREYLYPSLSFQSSFSYSFRQLDHRTLCSSISRLIYSQTFDVLLDLLHLLGPYQRFYFEKFFDLFLQGK